MKLLYEDKKSFKEVASYFGVTISSLVAFRNRHGIKPRNNINPPWNKKYPDFFNCKECGEPFPSNGRKAYFCSHRCLGKSKRGIKIPKISGEKHWHYNKNRESILNRQKDGNVFSYSDKKIIAKRQKFKCNVCYLQIEIVPIYKIQKFVVFDHVIPIKLNGEHSIENGQILCKNCDKEKTSKDLLRIQNL